MVKRVHSKFFIITYPTDFLNLLTLDIIENFYIPKNLNYLIVESQGDQSHNHRHFHCFIFNEEEEIRKYITYFDIPLSKKIYSFKFENSSEPVYQLIDYDKSELDKLKNECISFNLLDIAHPNIQYKKEYGSVYQMIMYCLDQAIDQRCNFDLDTFLIKQREIYEKQKKSKSTKSKQDDLGKPDFDKLKQQNMDFNEVKSYLCENYPKWMVYNWNKCQSGIIAVFGPKKSQFKIKNYNYYIPNTFLRWLENTLMPYIINEKNNDWLEDNRMNRPITCCWIGNRETGKTTFCRSLCNNNYWQCTVDNWDEWNSNYPLTIFDDFNSKWDNFFINWKCWVGAQTDFSINPKYDRRRKVSWGHPSVFLMNKLFDLPDKNDIDYCNRMLIIDTKNRKLWEKDSEDPHFDETHTLVNILELRDQLLKGTFKSPPECKYDKTLKLEFDELENNKHKIYLSITDNSDKFFDIGEKDNSGQYHFSEFHPSILEGKRVLNILKNGNSSK